MQRVPAQAPIISPTKSSPGYSPGTNSRVSIASLAAKYTPEQPLTKANIEEIYTAFKTCSNLQSSLIKETFITRMCDYLKVNGDRTAIFNRFDSNGRNITSGNTFKKSVSQHLAEIAQEQFKAGNRPDRQEANPAGGSSIHLSPYATPERIPVALVSRNEVVISAGTQRLTNSPSDPIDVPETDRHDESPRPFISPSTIYVDPHLSRPPSDSDPSSTANGISGDHRDGSTTLSDSSALPPVRPNDSQRYRSAFGEWPDSRTRSYSGRINASSISQRRVASDYQQTLFGSGAWL